MTRRWSGWSTHPRRTAGCALPSRIGQRSTGAQAPQGDAVAGVGGTPGGASRRLRLLPLLPTLPGLGRQAAGDHAPASSGGREAVRRLRRPDRCGHRSGHRHDAGGADLRRRHGGVQLHLRRGDLDPEPHRLDRRARPGIRVSEWRTARRRAGQPQGGDRAGLSLRAGRRSDVRRHGRSLRHGHSPGPAYQAA